MDLARLPGTRPQLRRDLRQTLTAHPQAESRASCLTHSGQALSDRVVAQAVTNEFEDLAFPYGEFWERRNNVATFGRPGELREEVPGRVGREQRTSRGNGFDRVQDLLLACSFQEVASGASAYRREDGLVVLGHGEHQHGGAGERLGDATGGIDSAGARQVEIHQDYVGPVGVRGPDGALRGVSLGYDCDVVDGIDQRSEAVPD